MQFEIFESYCGLGSEFLVFFWAEYESLVALCEKMRKESTVIERRINRDAQLSLFFGSID